MPLSKDKAVSKSLATANMTGAMRPSSHIKVDRVL